jgi:hypothetical protein
MVLRRLSHPLSSIAEESPTLCLIRYSTATKHIGKSMKKLIRAGQRIAHGLYSRTRSRSSWSISPKHFRGVSANLSTMLPLSMLTVDSAAPSRSSKLSPLQAENRRMFERVVDDWETFSAGPPYEDFWEVKRETTNAQTKP